MALGGWRAEAAKSPVRLQAADFPTILEDFSGNAGSDERDRAWGEARRSCGLGDGAARSDGAIRKMVCCYLWARRRFADFPAVAGIGDWCICGVSRGAAKSVGTSAPPALRQRGRRPIKRERVKVAMIAAYSGRRGDLEQATQMFFLRSLEQSHDNTRSKTARAGPNCFEAPPLISEQTRIVNN